MRAAAPGPARDRTAGERVGCLTFVARSSASAKAIVSQLRVVVRTLWSNPPCHGGRIVSTVLNNADLTRQWCAAPPSRRHSASAGASR